MVDWAGLSAVRQKVMEAFDRVPRPDLSLIRPLGCCNEHEPDFQWYRQHSWQEFLEKLPSGRFDPFEFPTLNPAAYHYFVPGILLATLDSTGRNLDEPHLWEQDWVGALIPLKENTERFVLDYLPLFDSPQREAVASHLELFNGWLAETRGYGDVDIEWAASQVWRSETQQ
jgi:hypothetical protein